MTTCLRCGAPTHSGSCAFCESLGALALPWETAWTVSDSLVEPTVDDLLAEDDDGEELATRHAAGIAHAMSRPARLSRLLAVWA